MTFCFIIVKALSPDEHGKSDQDKLISSIFEPDGTFKEYRKNWARRIQKIYEVDPLTCPKCSGKMKVIVVIEDKEVIKKILKHLGLWDLKAIPPAEQLGRQGLPNTTLTTPVPKSAV